MSTAVVSPDLIADALVRIVGFGLLAASTAGTAAFVFRWYSGDEIPDGIAVLIGVTTVAVWLNTQTALQDAIIGEAHVLDPGTAIYTVVAFAVSAIAADGGRRLGDYLARDVFAITTPRSIDDVSQLVRAGGRVSAVDLPKEIGDAEGYDPVDDATKATLAGETLLFPRRLDSTELRVRLIERLERDYGIGYVDVEFASTGAIERLAVGSKPAGIGPTLAPETVAIAFEADPGPEASPGDLVDIWVLEDEQPRRVTSGELRAIADDVVTVVVDADDASALEPTQSYRLVTVPGTVGASRELRSLLRRAAETITKVTVDADDALADTTVDALPVLVLAIERSDGLSAFPDADSRLEVGDVCYLLGRPDALRRARERNEMRANATETRVRATER